VCYWHAETRDLFSGDTLFEDSVGRQDLPGGDSQAIRKSLLEKVYTLPEDAKVWPGHGDPTTIGKEKHGNPFIRVAK
jgi:glyoxylase-like metal-dependent hydrolase (beta-lactamase superfamily II)